MCVYTYIYSKSVITSEINLVGLQTIPGCNPLLYALQTWREYIGESIGIMSVLWVKLIRCTMAGKTKHMGKLELKPWYCI